MRVVTRLALLLPLALFAAPALAQFGSPADPCLYGTAGGVLRGADVQAPLFTNGILFLGNQESVRNGYLVPMNGEDAGTSAVFFSDIWVGGKVAGEVRVGAARFTTPGTLHPGRTGDDFTPPTPEACAEADRVWVVSREDVASYLDGNAPEADLAEWPVHLGAPVLDGDGIEGNYDLEAGDQPAIRGDVTAFWAMTDTAPGPNPLGLPLGVDVTVEAFAFRQTLFAQHTFYHLTVTNRNRVPIDSAYVGLFVDVDLGEPADDYAATDTTNHMVFTYGMYESDPVYGVPPALGVAVLDGPLAPEANGRDDDRDGETDEAGELLGLTSSVHWFNGGGPLSVPINEQELYCRLQGLRNDCVPLYAFGFGIRDGAPEETPTTPFFYPGDPVAGEFWSPENVDGMGTRLGPRVDMYSLASGPVTLQPQSSTTATFAYLFAQGEDRFSSVRRLRGQARGVHVAHASGAFEATPVAGSAPPEQPLAIRRPRPNPFSGTTAIQLQGAVDTPVRVSVYDVLGRRLSTTETSAPEARVEIGAELASGVYVVRVEGRAFAETFTVVKTR